MVKHLATKVVTVSVLILVPVGCGGGDESQDAQPPTTSTTSTTASERVPVTGETLVGKWKQVGTLVVVLFRPNGTFAIDTSGDFVNPAGAAGKYMVRDSTVRFTTSAAGFCVAADTWEWKASTQDLTSEEYLYARFVKGGCNVPTGEVWIMTRVA